MSLAILFHFLCAQHVSDINISCKACYTDTTSNIEHQTKNNTTNVVIQQNSRKLLMMNILMSETCWAHKKWNKIASDIKLVFYSSTTPPPCSKKNVALSSYLGQNMFYILRNNSVYFWKIWKFLIDLHTEF